MGRNSTDFDRLLENLKGKHAKAMDEAFATMDNEEFALNYIKLLEFAAPKLQRTDVNLGGQEDNEINIIHTFKEEEDEVEQQG